ncbi:MAG: 3-deoxy-manno-octulosonate cytidylyltransferase [Bacteroidia bacterium]|nr:3-deoxy-manno-octulosonate cytidylyltransferase [Bacteroidia bacterium]
MNILGIIPARYGSTRLPGKPLVEINGKTMVQRVYEQAGRSQKLNKVVVATDNDKIFSHVREFGGEVMMTSPQHQSGTDRCAEIISKQEQQMWDVIVNIQGDEPFIQPEQIDLLCSCFDDDKTQIATLVKEIAASEELFNHNNVKVILNKYKQALYFSRSPIPYCRNFPEPEWLKQNTYYKHIGIYGYRANTLREIAELPKTKLEITESLEQLRWLENGYPIHAEITSIESVAIDTPDDLLKVKSI